jgi:predicted RNase H-like HicB family nuclease
MPKRYEYIGVFWHYNYAVSVNFHDIPGTCTQGDDMEEARYMAKDVLLSVLYGEENLPLPSTLEEIKAKEKEYMTEYEASEGYDANDEYWIVHKVEFETVAVEF